MIQGRFFRTQRREGYFPRVKAREQRSPSAQVVMNTMPVEVTGVLTFSMPQCAKAELNRRSRLLSSNSLEIH